LMISFGGNYSNQRNMDTYNDHYLRDIRVFGFEYPYWGNGICGADKQLSDRGRTGSGNSKGIQTSRCVGDIRFL